MHSHQSFINIKNGKPIDLNKIPLLEEKAFMEAIKQSIGEGKRVSSYFACSSKEQGFLKLYAVLLDDENQQFMVTQTKINSDKFTSLATVCPQLQLFEREIAEQYGCIPVGHPWLKPVRYHHSWTDQDAWNRKEEEAILPGVGDYFKIEGDQVHEVAVGPVHAGVIEPGHFRFQCQGEEVLHLEIALGYQHRGIEKALIGRPDKKTRHYMDVLAGDTTIGHCLTYCQNIEGLMSTEISERSKVLRGIALELERMANHVGDLGSLANDIGYLPTASFCGRIRGEWLNLTALITGNRFGRNFLIPGGTSYDLTKDQIVVMLNKIKLLEKETEDAISLLWDNQSVLARFEEAGILSRKQGEELGLVGVAARATGLGRDIRTTMPSGVYKKMPISIRTAESGDVYARAYVRGLEIKTSVEFIKKALGELLKNAPNKASQIVSSDSIKANSFIVTVNEGWRGEICHVAITDNEGKFERYKIVDPSFHNWMGVAVALRNEEISDFPICNKSFNLSYCGHDL
ncbi:MAG: NADH-quinone oxidoreductase subunit C [Peptostreptococcaceae bacterium]|nr:NADH-quinone oxidoreductase subunit C [Peptostreptococcaceae bacterium]